MTNSIAVLGCFRSSSFVTFFDYVNLRSDSLYCAFNGLGDGCLQVIVYFSYSLLDVFQLVFLF